MKTFETLEDVRDYLNTIPSKKWCGYIRDDGKGKHCALGHLDKALGRDSTPLMRKLDPAPTMWDNLPIVNVNNKAAKKEKDIKRAVIGYLNKRIEGITV